MKSKKNIKSILIIAIIGIFSLVFFNKKRNKVKKCICKTKNGKRRICDFFCQNLRQNYQKYSQKKTKDCINTGKSGKIEKRRE